MEEEKSFNFFIIERLDQEEESEHLSNIYDLSILNKIKEIKVNNNEKKNQELTEINIKKIEIESDKLNQEKKKEIMKVIKKAILSSNLTYKWKLITFRHLLIFFHIFLLVSSISTNIKENNRNSLIDNYENNTNYTNFTGNSFNITNELNTSYYILNDTYSTLLNNKKINAKAMTFSIIVSQVMLIPIWIVLFFKLIPKWNKINDNIYKFTNHLILCESYENKEYFYYLMRDYSIFITKKEYYNQNKDILPISQIKNENIIEKNIFLYSINIIIDYILDDIITVNYFELISRNDYNDINILVKYVEKNLHDKLKKFNRHILIPIIISTIISILYTKNTSEYFFFSLILLILILLITRYLFKEYIKNYKFNIDKFIDIFNEILIKKNRFIYRKNNLVMYLALKNNNLNKNQIIKNIEKIINS